MTIMAFRRRYLLFSSSFSLLLLLFVVVINAQQKEPTITVSDQECDATTTEDGQCVNSNSNNAIDLKNQDLSNIKVAVMGGLGIQGGAVIDYLLQNSNIKPENIRTSTRNPNNEQVKKLFEKGIKISVEDEPSSYKNVWKNMFFDADLIFLMTFTDYSSGGQGELNKGKELFDFIIKELPEIPDQKSKEMQHIVFSGGELTSVDILNTKYNIEEYARSILLDDENFSTSYKIQCTFLHTSYFYENLVRKDNSKRYKISTSYDTGEDNKKHKKTTVKFELPLPVDREISAISARDIGNIAGHILLTKPLGDVTTSLTIVGDLVSPEKLLGVLEEDFSTINNSTNNKLFEFTYGEMTYDMMKTKMGQDSANFVQTMYNELYKQNSDRLTTARRMSMTKDIYPDIMDLPTWMKKHFIQDVKKEAFLSHSYYGKEESK